MKAVANDLKVQLAGMPRDDSEIAAAIAHVLDNNVQIPPGQVHARVIRDAGTAEKAAIYDQLDLKATFKPGEAKIRAEVTIGPENYVEHAQQCGDMGRVRGGT